MHGEKYGRKNDRWQMDIIWNYQRTPQASNKRCQFCPSDSTKKRTRDFLFGHLIIRSRQLWRINFVREKNADNAIIIDTSFLMSTLNWGNIMLTRPTSTARLAIHQPGCTAVLQYSLLGSLWLGNIQWTNHLVGDKTAEWMEKNSWTPFFVWLCHRFDS